MEICAWQAVEVLAQAVAMPLVAAGPVPSLARLPTKAGTAGRVGTTRTA